METINVKYQDERGNTPNILIPKKHRNKDAPCTRRIHNYVMKQGINIPFTCREISKATRTSIHTVRDTLSKMLSENIVERKGSPRWGITWKRI